MVAQGATVILSDPFPQVTRFDSRMKSFDFAEWYDLEFLPVAKQSNLDSKSIANRLRSCLDQSAK